ncbi:MAG TPA: copper amine oxidase, partial [Phycisphaerales bacterium]|nr:copper amine oxidase [Phycisphaerales bacterium]
MSQLYATIPLRYPRVKMVNWYDCNNLIQAKSDRRLNNYQLTKPQAVLEAYQ